MKQQELTYTFHDPNTEEETINMVLRAMFRINLEKAEAAIMAFEHAEVDKGTCSLTEDNPSA